MFLSRDEVRSLDRRASEEFGMPGLALMENAGRGAAELLLRLSVGGRVVICAGKGNNAGDGFVMARHLDNHHIDCHVVLLNRAHDLSGDAAVNFHVIDKAGLPIEVNVPFDEVSLQRTLANADWVVDALFGTGLTGPVRPPYDSAVALINQSAARVLAVDIPSGLDCDTGRPLGPTVKANHTATFVAPKKGFPSAQEWLGEVHVLDIGAPRRLLAMYQKD
jgi:NAD(P)H-hydrate epimerase